MSPGPDEAAKRILFRCDGTAETGLGHLSRCLALAEALTDASAACRFIGNYGDSGLALLSGAGMDSVPHAAGPDSDADLALTLHAAEEFAADLCLVDHYGIDDPYLVEVHAATPVWLIDDFGARSGYRRLCRGLLNFTVDAPNLPYPREDVRCLLGPGYLPVRRALRELRSADRVPTAGGRKLLIAIGGHDRFQLTTRIVETLIPEAADWEIRAIVGGSYEGREHLADLLKHFASGSRVESNLPNLAEPFGWADLCLCGGGLTKYESAYLGVPVGVLSQTDEQADETVQFAAQGLAADLGRAESLEPERLLRWLNNAESHVALHRASREVFPLDPTGAAATEILRD